MRRRGRPGLGARAAREQLREAVRSHPLEHRPDQHPDHVAHKSVGLDPEREHVLGLLDPPGAQHVAAEAHVVRLGGREGGEVVSAEKCSRTGIERVAVERARPPERAPLLERARRAARVEAIAVGPRAGVAAGVETVARGFAGERGHVRGQQRVQIAERGRLALVARHLPARVDPPVGPAGHREPYVPAKDRPERLLHRPDARLSGPAAEVRAVVLEQQAGGHPRLRATISAYSFASRAGRSSPTQRWASSSASAVSDSQRSGGRFCFAATQGGAEVPSIATSASGDSASHASSLRSTSKCAARPSKRSRTFSSTDHSSESGWSEGGAYLRPSANSSALKPSFVQAVIPTVPPGRTTRNSSSATTRGRGAIMAPKTEPTQSKLASSNGSASASASTHSTS